MFTETWLGKEVFVQVNGFKQFQLNRTLKKRTAKRDSGGVLVYIRDELVSDNTLFLTDSDDLRLDGRLLNLDKDLFLCLCYNVPEGSSRLGLIDNVDIFDRISDHMVHIQNITNNKCSFMICGDLN